MKSDPRAVGPMLLVDAANVIGSRPDGWWRDRPGAARRFVERVRAAVASGALDSSVVVVVEGRSRAGVAPGIAEGVEVVHAPGEGDDTVATLADRPEASARGAVGGGRAGLAAGEVAGAAGDGGVIVVTADRALAQRVRAVGAEVVGPTWLLDRLPE